MDINIIIGGPQGGGIETAGFLAIRSLALCGLEVFADREYHSNIKGKHSYAHIRGSDGKKGSIKYPVDALGALDAETLATHFHEVREGGLVVHDAALSGKSISKIAPMDSERLLRLQKAREENGIGDTVQALDQWLEAHGVKVVAIPFSKLLVEVLKLPNPSIERAMNTAVTSAIMSTVGIQKNAILEAVGFLFREKKEMLDINLKIAEGVCEAVKPYAGREMAIAQKTERKRLIVAGNDSVAIGKVLGGLRLQTYYPITPAADESFTLEQNNDLKDLYGNSIGSPVVIQAEDEISAIAMAIGGALAGARTATSTSGPGFSLMVEGLGWAGNSEVPVVVTMYQRGGPSTGLPTRNSQSDLLFSIYAGHGEFARIVIASGDHSEATVDAAKCMNYAEEYQIPVIHLLDKGLANCITTTPIDFEVEVRRGKREKTENGTIYKRFKFTDDCISPRAFLGEKMMWYTGDEHNEFGHISEDPVIRNEMYEKRMCKSKKILSEMQDLDKAVLRGPEDYEDLILTWGTTKGAAVDALSSMNALGRKVAVLQVRMMEPFPADYIAGFLSKAERVLSVEANYQGMLADLVEAKCNAKIGTRLVKFNGRLVSEDEVISGYKRVLNGETRIVLEGGE